MSDPPKIGLDPAEPGMTLEMLDAAVVLLGKTGGEGVVRLTGRSMLPTLKAGQRLSVGFHAGGPGRGRLHPDGQYDYAGRGIQRPADGAPV